MFSRMFEQHFAKVRPILLCGTMEIISELFNIQLSVPQIEYPLGGSSKKGSHVYFLLQVFWVILLFEINVLLMLPL